MEDFDTETAPEERKKFMGIARLAIMFAVVAVLSFGGGFLAAANGKDLLAHVPLISDGLDATPDPDANLTDFWKVWNTLNTRFVQTHGTSTPPTAKEKVWGAIEGLTKSLGDPYTVFMRPQDAKVFADDIAGNFVGVGMEIGVNKEGILTVIAPLKGTPAEKAGMRPGDQIISIDGKSTEGMATDAAVKLIRGEKGTPVVFKIFRNGELSDVTVIRDTIEIPNISNELDPASGVYTIALYTFTANSASQFNGALAEFRKSGSHLLLIDLRGNPGGYLEAAVRIASDFLPEGTTVVTEDYKGHQENIVHRTKAGGSRVPEGTKVAILIDQGSASASEILSGALQDNHAATLIGTRSFGKGSVQELVDIDGGALKVTVARWLTPSGRSISDGGLTPDIKVERTQDDVLKGKDPQKERAIQFLSTGK